MGWWGAGPIVTAYRPVGVLAAKASEAFSRRVQRHFILSDRAAANEELKREVADLRLENMTLKARDDAAGDFRRAAETSAYAASDLLPVRLIAADLFPASRAAIIDGGSDQGVRVDDAVIASGGLVGRVVSVFARSSKILLLTDPLFAVDAVDGRSGIRVLVSGLAESSLEGKRVPPLAQVEYLENAAALREGDPLITSGLGGVFPAGIPVGRVERVWYSQENLFDKARILPAADFATLTRAYVILKRDLRAPIVVVSPDATGTSAPPQSKRVPRRGRR